MSTNPGNHPSAPSTKPLHPQHAAMHPSYAFTNTSILSLLTRSRLTNASILPTRIHRHRPTYPKWTSSSAQPTTTPPPSRSDNPAVVTTPRRLRKGDTLDLVISKLAYGGASVAYVPPSVGVADEDIGMPVYAPKGACPGQRIRCAITKVRRRSPENIDPSINHGTPVATRSYAEAVFLNSVASSPQALSVPCKHFGHFKLGGGGCGGCSSMNVAYEEQLSQKQSQMNNVFAKICAKYRVQVLPIIGSESTLYYRNKMEYSFGRRWYEANAQPDEHGGLNGPGDYEYTVGLHVPQRYNKVVQIEDCHIQDPVGSQILNFVRRRSQAMLLEAYDTMKNDGYLRNVGIRTSKNAQGELEVMVNLITSPCDVPKRLVPLATEIVEKFPSVVCVVQNISGVRGHHTLEQDRERLLAGSRMYIEQSLCGLTFRISSNSFFQTNPEQASVLYSEVEKAAKLSKSQTVVDLFCGTGTIALTLAKYAKNVVGIDVIEAAIQDARVNASENNVSNAQFERGNLEILETILDGAGIPETDVIIIDPPRAGLHPDLVKHLSKSDAKRIVYVSCNPVSQVQDLEKLDGHAEGRFHVTRIQPVDMFPNTPHVECVVSLERSR